jgi:pyruvate kinase
VTESGGVARLVSEYRPPSALVALTSRKEVFQRLALYWGVEPVLMTPAKDFGAMTAAVERALTERSIAKPGELAVIAVALPFGSGLSANTLHIHKLGG